MRLWGTPFTSIHRHIWLNPCCLPPLWCDYLFTNAGQCWADLVVVFFDLLRSQWLGGFHERLSVEKSGKRKTWPRAHLVSFLDISGDPACWWEVLDARAVKDVLCWTKPRVTKHRLASFFSCLVWVSWISKYRKAWQVYVTCRLSPDARHSQCDISPLGKKPGRQIKRPKNCKGNRETSDFGDLVGCIVLFLSKSALSTSRLDFQVANQWRQTGSET